LTGTADPTIELIGGTNTNQGNAADTWWDMYTTGTPYSTTTGTHSTGEHFALRRRTGTVDSEMVSVFASGNVGIGADGAGSAGTVSNAGNRLTVSNNDAVTSAITNVVALQHNSTGTPAANFGTGLVFRGKDSTTRNQDMASVNAIWTAANHSNHVSALTFSTDSIGVTSPTEKVRIAGNGFVGVNTTNPGVRMHINGGYATTSSTDTLTSSVNNDVPVGDCAYLRLYSASPFTITGLAAGVDGQRLRIVDITGVDMTVANGSTLSAFGNRIETDVGSDIIVRGTVPVLDMTYDAGLNEWLLGTLNANQIVGGVGSIIYAVKTNDQNVTNSTVLVNDNDLAFTVSPNQTWEINGELDCENTNNNVGIKIALTIPAASSMKVDFTSIASAGGNAITGEDALSASGVSKNISILSGQPSLVNVRGIIVTGANGGTVQLKWAQVTASNNSTTMKAQSYMKLIRVK
ncbi:MAG: hypothetical protein Q8919_06240, partial [Bacteroidota bacterium]|nr:hypothetical protein [Bacteroidota bacterium]